MDEGKKILLIAPQYFGYDQLLRDCLREMGAAVDLLPDRPLNHNLAKAMFRLNRNIAKPVADRFYQTRIPAFNRPHYDAILVVQGEALSPAVLQWMRAEFPGARLVWYMWDSFDNKPLLKENLPLFDSVHSFDPQDVQKYGLELRPLFYSPEYASIQSREKHEYKYDLCFVGTGHADRYPIIQGLERALDGRRKFYRFIYFQSHLLYLLRRVFDRRLKGARKVDFSFIKMPHTQVRNIIEQSRIILDIHHPAQRGLTIRTLEALGGRRKLVTTNLNVRDYDFYNNKNIHIMDRNYPRVPESFFQEDYEPLESGIYRKYSVSEFLKSLLGQDFFK